MPKKLLILVLLAGIVCQGQTNIYDILKDSIDNSWIKPSEELTSTKPSYFNSINSQNIFISPLEVSGYGVPFSWDSDLSILKFLSAKDSTIVIKTGKEANSEYLGTKITWNNNKTALLFLDNEINKSFMTDWYLFGRSECPKMHLFPLVNFEELYKSPFPMKNDSKGIVLFPAPPNIKTISESRIKLYSKGGNSLLGTAYDLNNDQIQDVFIYQDSEFDRNGAKQKTLYINLNGTWVRKWNHLYETKCF
jgi:hypothetical protein